MLAGQIKKKNKEMTDKTREELIEEIKLLQGRIAKFEKDEPRRKELEDKVIRRSVELARTNVDLQDEIKERNKSQEELQKSEIKFRTLVENIPDKVFIKDKNLIYIFCNKNYADSLNMTTGEIIGKTDFDLFPKDLAEKYRSDDKRIIKKGKTEDIEEKYTKNGEERWANTIKTPYKDEKGKTIGVLGVFRDITERKKVHARR